MSSSSIFHWFAPPEFGRADLRRHARALWIASWPFFAVITVALGVAVLVEPHTFVRRATTVAAVGALITALHMTSRAGRPVLASWMLVIGLCVVVTQRAWMVGGIHAPVAMFYALFIVMAGALLGRRGAVVTSTACTLGAATLFVGTALGWLAPRPGSGPTLNAFIFTILAICLALVIDAVVTLQPQREGLDVDAVQSVVADMRSPMQVLVSRLEMIRNEVEGESAKDAEEALRGMRSLRRITSTLLDVSRLEAGQMPIRRSITDLSSLARAVVSNVRAAQPTCDIAVEAQGDSISECDLELTQRVVETLVSNAVRVTAIEGRVRVIVAGSQHTASIAVADEGQPVPPDQRARIFEPYCPEQLRRAAGEDSAGLGLVFCRLAVEAQGGAIRIEDSAQRGNTFVIEFPR